VEERVGQIQARYFSPIRLFKMFFPIAPLALLFSALFPMHDFLFFGNSPYCPLSNHPRNNGHTSLFGLVSNWLEHRTYLNFSYNFEERFFVCFEYEYENYCQNIIYSKWNMTNSKGKWLVFWVCVELLSIKPQGETYLRSYNYRRGWINCVHKVFVVQNFNFMGKLFIGLGVKLIHLPFFQLLFCN